MSAVPQSKIEPSTITGKYQVLGAFLAAAELLLGYWFFKAVDGTERIVAGSLMTVILLAFLFAFYFLVSKKEESENPTVPGIGQLNLPTKETTVEKIASPEPATYVAPNRSYTINRPPDNWRIEELTLNEWAAQGMGVTDPDITKKVLGEGPEQRDIVIFQTGQTTSVAPMPGKTTINGRKYPTALEVSSVIRLGILPMPRMAQPPLFVEHPLIHNFTSLLCEILKTGMMTIYEETIGKVPNTQRQQITASFRQDVENVIINGQEGKSMTANIVVIGIEGDLQDHILIMQYPALKDVKDPELEQAQETLNKLLVPSFRPVKVPNIEQMLKESKAEADQNFQLFMENNGETIFKNEFVMLLFRLSGTNLDDPENRLRVIKLLKTFKIFADEVHFQNEDVDQLWVSLREAEEGNALNLKADLERLIEKARTAPENPDLPPPAEGEDKAADDEEETPT